MPTYLSLAAEDVGAVVPAVFAVVARTPTDAAALVPDSGLHRTVEVKPIKKIIRNELARTLDNGTGERRKRSPLVPQLLSSALYWASYCSTVARVIASEAKGPWLKSLVSLLTPAPTSPSTILEL